MDVEKTASACNRIDIRPASGTKARMLIISYENRHRVKRENGFHSEAPLLLFSNIKGPMGNI